MKNLKDLLGKLPQRNKKEKLSVVVKPTHAEGFCRRFGADIYEGTIPRIERPSPGDTLTFEEVKVALALDRKGHEVATITANYNYFPAEKAENSQEMFQRQPIMGEVYIQRYLRNP